jgi:hypothetical protein
MNISNDTKRKFDTNGDTLWLLSLPIQIFHLRLMEIALLYIVQSSSFQECIGHPDKSLQVTVQSLS